MKKYIVTLAEHERDHLLALVGSGQMAARMLTHAHILLQADTGNGRGSQSDETISQALQVHATTVANVRRAFVEESFEVALHGRPRTRSGVRLLDGAQEAYLIALACSPPPVGHDRWTLRLLADKMVELESVSAVSHETIRQTLKKTNSSPGSSRNGVSRRRPTRNS